MVAQQAMLMTNSFRQEADMPLPSYGSADAGQSAEDLFLYPIPKLTLKRGETATVPLFTAAMPYEHIYTWQIADWLDANERYNSYDNQRDQAPPQEEVWHICRLTNSGKLPLTTAPAMFTKNSQIVGQDICYFTSPGDHTDIRINRAIRVSADQQEFEIKRERNAVTFRSSSYDKLTIRGELKLTSYQPEKIHIEITKNLSGEIIENKDNAKVIDTAKRMRAVNAHRQLLWTIDLEPGKSTTLTYQYTVLVH